MLCDGALERNLTEPPEFAADCVIYDGVHASIIADCSVAEQISSDVSFLRFFGACFNAEKAALLVLMRVNDIS